MDVVNDNIVLWFSLGLKKFIQKWWAILQSRRESFIPFSWVLIGFCTNTHSFQYLCSLLASFLHEIRILHLCTVCSQTYLFRRTFANFIFWIPPFRPFRGLQYSISFTPYRHKSTVMKRIFSLHRTLMADRRFSQSLF